jgi:DNA-binding protein YbaB
MEFSILKSGSPNSGASVGVLKYLIIILNGLTQDNKEAIKKNIRDYYKAGITCLNLSPIICGMIDDNIDKGTIIRFLFDYKRAGDHEQVNSTAFLNKLFTGVAGDTVLVTGDRLCSLYARLIKQPCIFIHDDFYDMYKYFPAPNNGIKKGNLIRAFEAAQKNILDSLSLYETHGFLLNDSYAHKTRHLTEMINTYLTQQQLADDFNNKLYEISFKCLLKKIERMIALMKTINGDARVYSIEITEKTLDSGDVSNISDEIIESIKRQIKDLNDIFDVFSNKYKEIFDYLSFFKDEDLPKEINSNNVSKFKSNAFGYDNKTLNGDLLFNYNGNI